MSTTTSFGDVYPGTSVQGLSASQGPTVLQWERRHFQPDMPCVGSATTGVCLTLLDGPQRHSKAMPLDTDTLYSVYHDVDRGLSRVSVTNQDTKVGNTIYATGGSRLLAYIALTAGTKCETFGLQPRQRLIVRTDGTNYTILPFTEVVVKPLAINGNKVTDPPSQSR